MILALLTALAAPDVALPTNVEGEVVLTLASGSEPLAAFGKLRAGDVVNIPAKGRIDLLYFVDGRSEVFEGPLVLTIGGEAAPVSMQKGDALVGKALRQLPALARRAEADKGGHTLVRGVVAEAVPLDDDEKEEIEAAKAHYTTLRATATEADVVPELYLSTVYLSLGQEAEARTVLEGAVARCPACVATKGLLDALER